MKANQVHPTKYIYLTSEQYPRYKFWGSKSLLQALNIGEKYEFPD